MAKRAIRQEILAAAQEERLNEKSEKHLSKTFDSLTRNGRTKSQNPKHISVLNRNYGEFRKWSLANGFSLDAELELLGRHVVPGTKLIHEHIDPQDLGLPEWFSVKKVVLVTAEEIGEIPETKWVTDYESVRWVNHNNLARRRKKYLLTAYGKGRFKARRKALRLELDGESKTASAWAEDPRCMVSDKVLKRRKEEGWSDADAILTPPRRKAGDR